jgi:general secretion pathway protein N
MSLKHKILWSLAALLGFLVMLIATAPASLLPRIGQKFVPGLVVSGESGSLWQGRAQQLNFGWLQLTDLEWQLSPWALVLGRLDADIAFGGQSDFRGRLSLRASREAQQFDGVDLRIPAERVQAFVKTPGLQLQGEFLAELDSLRLENALPTAVEGRLQWHRAVIKTPLGQPPLGSYAVHLHTAEDGRIVGTLNDLEGVLDLKGELSYRAPQLTLEANTRSDLPEQLDRFFRAVGRPENGRYVLQWQQNLPR